MAAWYIRRFPLDRQTMSDQPAITRPPLPDRIGRLARARVGHLVGVEPRGPQRLPGAGLRPVAELGAQPGAAAAADPGRAARAGGARSDVPGPLRPGDQGPRSRPQRRGQLVGAAARHRPDARHRLLLRRVRAAPVAADLRRRPRRAGRRPLQGSQRPGPAVRRHRVHVSAGLLPPERLVGGLAGRALPAAELGRRADRAGVHARRQAVRHRRAARPAHRARLRSGTSSSVTRSSTCSTPISRRTRRGIASCRRASTAATARPASSRRSSSASAASAPCARSASTRRCGISTKGTPASWCCNASTSSSSRACRSRTP